MLFVSWQLKTVYVIFLTSCLGQELIRTSENDYSFERSIRRQRFKTEQPGALPNERSRSDERLNRILENHEKRLSTVTDRFYHRAEEDHKVWNRYQALNQLNERFAVRQESEKHLNNNREENEKVFERVDTTTHERIPGRDVKNNHEERRVAASQEIENRLDNREKSFSILDRFERERVSGRDFANVEEERRAFSKLEEVRRSNTARELSRVTKPRYEENKLVSRQNILKPFDVHEASELLDMKRNDRQRNENLRRDYRNRGMENERLSVSRRQRDSNGNIHRQVSSTQTEYNIMNRRSERINELIVRNVRGFERQERNSYSSRRQNILLSARGSESPEAIKNRRSEITTQNRRGAQFDATVRSVTIQKESESTSPEFKYNVKSIRDNRNGRQENNKRLHKFERQLESQDVNSDVQYIDSEGRTDAVTQNREELNKNSRLAINQNARDHASLRLANEPRIYFRRPSNGENEDVRDRLERRVDREMQANVNGHSKNFHQDIAQRFETRRSSEREMMISSQDTQRSRIDIAERNNLVSQRFESTRQDNEHYPSSDEKHERRSVRRDERFDYWSVERQLNDKRDERNNAFIIVPKTTNMYSYYRNNRFIEEDSIEKPTVLLFNLCMALGQGLLFAYVVMKTCNGKNDLINQLQTKLRGALLINGF